MPSVDAILMASGFSTRFGQNKLLAPFQGRALAAHTLELACGCAEFGNVWLVCASPQVAALAAGTRAHVLHNSVPGRGACESIRLGVQASHAQHYMFFTCDQPLLDTRTLHSLLACRAPGRIVVPQHQGQPGSPAIFSASFRPELLNLRDGENARSIKLQNPAALYYVPVHSPWPLFDIDTPEDLARAEQNARHNPIV